MLRRCERDSARFESGGKRRPKSAKEEMEYFFKWLTSPPVPRRAFEALEPQGRALHVYDGPGVVAPRRGSRQLRWTLPVQHAQVEVETFI